MSYNLFVSYSRSDADLVRNFCDTAAKRGLSVWWDGHITAGGDWRKEIVSALSSAKGMVIFFSRASNGSTQLMKEIAIADKQRKPIIPVLIEDAEPEGAYLYELATRNWINLVPDPASRIPTLVENLAARDDVGLTGQAAPAPKAAKVPAHAAAPEGTEPAARRVQEEAVAPPSKAVQQQQQSSPATPNTYWVPLKAYDFVIGLAAWAGAFYFATAGEIYTGRRLFAIVAVLYLIVIAVRNARNNMSIFSGRSFGGYLVVLVVMTVALAALDVSGHSEKAFDMEVFASFLVISVVMAGIANVLQVIIRKIFMRNLFRTAIQEPLKPAPA